MSKQRLPKVPEVKNWEVMNDINGLLFYKEQLKIETDAKKKNKFQQRFNELQLKIKKYETNVQASIK